MKKIRNKRNSRTIINGRMVLKLVDMLAEVETGKGLLLAGLGLLY